MVVTFEMSRVHSVLFSTYCLTATYINILLFRNVKKYTVVGQFVRLFKCFMSALLKRNLFLLFLDIFLFVLAEWYSRY